MVILGMDLNSRYYDEPLLDDVRSIVAHWLAMPMYACVDLCDEDRKGYEEGIPMLGPARAAGFLVENKQFKQREGLERPSLAGFRLPGVYVFERCGTGDMDSLPWETLGGPCPKCGVEFLFYGPNGRPRTYCERKCAAAAKTQRARERRKSPTGGLTSG
jgi:hypothetical protein